MNLLQVSSSLLLIPVSSLDGRDKVTPVRQRRSLEEHRSPLEAQHQIDHSVILESSGRRAEETMMDILEKTSTKSKAVTDGSRYFARLRGDGAMKPESVAVSLHRLYDTASFRLRERELHLNPPSTAGVLGQRLNRQCEHCNVHLWQIWEAMLLQSQSGIDGLLET